LKHRQSPVACCGAAWHRSWCRSFTKGRARARPGRREARERELLSAYGQLGDANEVLNERAVAVMKRMSDKLTGRDFLQARHPRSAVPARCGHVLCARLW